LKVFFLIGFSFLFSLVAAQEVETISLSVNSSGQDITIKWKAFSDTSLIDWYVIYQWKPIPSSPQYWGIDTATAIFVPKTETQKTFTCTNVNEQFVKFIVYAQKGPAKYPTKEYPQKNISSTIFNETRYDSCVSSIGVKWNQYQGWGPKSTEYRGNVKQYQIIRDGAIIGTATDTIYTDLYVEQNKSYTYYIRAIQESDNTITSQSNIDTIYTATTQPPAFIIAESAIYNNGLVELNFQLDATSKMKNYQLTRSQTQSGPFTRINEPYINYLTGSLKAVDQSPLPATAYYRLEALNNCLLPTKVSNTATAVVPKIVLNAQIINITWDEYLTWDGGVSEYQVYHKLGSEDATWYQTINSSDPLICTENITSLVGKNIQGNICYYIKMVSAGTNRYESTSQTVCIDLSSEIYIPNAFTPDGNGQNDWFSASFAFLPVDFKMYIYNRYGYKVFETSNLKGWNGVLKDGKKAPEGAYVYFIYYTSGDGKRIEKKGALSLIYP
jgi:gliding motility-associated-like protein